MGKVAVLLSVGHWDVGRMKSCYIAASVHLLGSGVS